jgi:hypothetical protein
MPSSISRNLIHWFLNLSNNFQTHLFHLNDSFMMWFFQQIKKIQYNNCNKNEAWLPNFFASYFMMFSLHISIVSKSQNHETYAYSKYQPYILEFHTVATKSTSLRDVFQLSSHILCKAYINFQGALLEGCQPPRFLEKSQRMTMQSSNRCN